MDCEKLQEKLDRSASYRKKEISNLTLQIQTVEGDVKNALLRASVLMLYAHFEGFSKDAIKIFIKHLNAQNVPVSSLQHYLQTLFYTKKISLIKNATRKEIYNELIEEILLGNSECFRVNEEATGIVFTDSNLKFEVLKDLLFIIGIRTEEFRLLSERENNTIHTKQEFIDREILGVRNAIAHGEGKKITLSQFDEIKKFVVDYIDSLKEYIVQISETRSYIKQ